MKCPEGPSGDDFRIPQKKEPEPPIREESEYQDILNMEPPALYGHPRMERAARAAQFAPFAALPVFGAKEQETDGVKGAAGRDDSEIP